MSETQEPQRPNESTYALDPVPGEPGDGIEEESERPKKSTYVLGQPLPRLWKTEPDPSEEPEETDPGSPLKKIGKGGDGDKPTPKQVSKPKPPKAKAKPKSTDEGDENEKKVLVEETPTFDTYEARQRARLIVGGLGVFCLMLFCYIGYRILFGDDSRSVDMMAEEPSTPQALPTAHLSLDHEARYMLNRAQEFAKAGRTDQAIGMLKRVVSSYKGTESAAEARAALDRPGQNLPLFPDGPAVLAERKPVGPPPGSCKPTSGTSPGPAPAATGPIAMGPAPVVMTPAQPRPQQSQSSPAQPSPVQAQPAQPSPVQAATRTSANAATGSWTGRDARPGGPAWFRGNAGDRGETRQRQGRGHSPSTEPAHVAARLQGQGRGGPPRIGLAAGHRRRARRRPDGPGARRHVHHGERQRRTGRGAGPYRPFVDLLHRPA